MRGYKAFLTSVILPANVTEPTSVWPEYWVKTFGGRQTRAPNAPEVAFILPLDAVDSTGAAVNFRLSTETGSTASTLPFETVNPNLLLPAFVTRWLSLPYQVGEANLWLYGDAGAVGPTTVTFWYFYQDADDGCQPVKLSGPQGPGFMVG